MDALMKEVSGWVRVGNPAVDMIAEAIYTARKQKRPLRSIHLKPAYFSMVVAFTAKHAGEEKIFDDKGNLCAPITCDGVAIMKGSQLQLHTMSFDFWPIGHMQVEGYREQHADKGEYPEHLSLIQ